MGQKIQYKDDLSLYLRLRRGFMGLFSKAKLLFIWVRKFKAKELFACFWCIGLARDGGKKSPK